MSTPARTGGQRVVVIAGAGGAGSALARAFADNGDRVVVLDAREPAAQAAVAPLLAESLPAEAHSVNLLDLDEVIELYDDLVSRLGRVDVLVHLVGGWRGSPTLDLDSFANWNALNPPIVGTLAALTAVFGDAVRRAEHGRVLMVTSTAVAKPTAGNIAYVAAKAAAEAWMGGVEHYFRDSDATAVIVAVKALLTDAMASAEPDKKWPGYTHVDELATAIVAASRPDVTPPARLDLTAAGYSAT